VKGGGRPPPAEGWHTKQPSLILARLPNAVATLTQLPFSFKTRSIRKMALECFPITWTHVIEKEALRFKELEHVLIEKVEQLFRDMLWPLPASPKG
jgi:hypothetical protein